MGHFFFSMIFVFNSTARADVTETDFNEAVKQFVLRSQTLTKEYHPKKLALKASPDWSATRGTYPWGAGLVSDSSGAWIIQIAGWLAREPLATQDAMDFVMCHELGHVASVNQWQPGVNIELLADDFAARSCLRLIWRESFTPERVMATTEYTWRIRVSANPKFDPEKCTVKQIQKAALNQLSDFHECSH